MMKTILPYAVIYCKSLFLFKRKLKWEFDGYFQINWKQMKCNTFAITYHCSTVLQVLLSFELISLFVFNTKVILCLTGVKVLRGILLNVALV